MPDITDIRLGPRGSRRRRVYIDGEEWRALPAEVVRDIGLRVGQQVEPTVLDQRIAESEPARAWERALRLLNYRERGSGELHRRLTEDGYLERVVGETVSRAADLGFVDDRRFADGLVRLLVDGKHLGRRRVAAQLSAKGVSEELIAELLESCCSPEDEHARAVALATRLSPRCRNEPDRLAARLISKGYATRVALRAATAVCEAADVPLDEE